MLVRISVLTMLFALVLSCRSREVENTIATEVEVDIVQFIKERYSNSELDQLQSDFIEYLSIGKKYNLAYARSYERFESSLLDTFFVNTSLNRALLLIATRSEGDVYINSSIKPRMAFLNGDKWHFLSADGVHMIQAADVGTTSLLTFEELAEYAREKLLKGYLIRDPISEEVKINDLFFKNYMEYSGSLGSRGVSSDSIQYLSDSFWTNRYMDFIRIWDRRIEVIEERRVMQDSLRAIGEIDDNEWTFIQRMRNPQNHKDWRRMDSIYKKLDQDSTIQLLMDKARN